MTKPKPKPEIWWTIKTPEGMIYLWYTWRQKSAAISDFLSKRGFNDWRRARAAGYRAVKIRVTEV